MSIDPSQITLADVQGNILKGHGRTFTALVFFRFAQRNQAAWKRNRRLLRDAATGAETAVSITSAARQNDDTRKNKESGKKDQQPFRSFGLTKDGLAACGHGEPGPLGITDVNLATDQFWNPPPSKVLTDERERDEAFAMNPDGVFLLAHENEAERNAMVEATTERLAQSYDISAIKVEPGFRWQPNKDKGDGDTAAYEPFGFADGIARTKIGTKPESVLGHLVSKNQTYALGFKAGLVAPAEIPLERVMISSPGAFLGGSFLVVHKLEQNVRAFLTAEQDLRRRLELPGNHTGVQPADAGALFIGRKRDGTPLVEGIRDRTNTFDFNRDAGGARCPFSAHIRKMNPRQDEFLRPPHDQAGRANQNAALMVRRSVLYGDPANVRLAWESTAAAPDGKVGTLFMGYMAGVGPQFLRLLVNWATHVDFPQQGSGPDSLLAGGAKDWHWAGHEQLTEGQPPLTLGHFVKSKGAAFFVIPPLHWLRTV